MHQRKLTALQLWQHLVPCTSSQHTSTFILILEAADASGQVTKAVLITHLKEFFRILASKEVSQWIQHFTEELNGKHLAYMTALEMHSQ